MVTLGQWYRTYGEPTEWPEDQTIDEAAWLWIAKHHWPHTPELLMYLTQHIKEKRTAESGK